MGFASKIFGEKKSDMTGGYVDLEKYVECNPQSSSFAKMHIALGEIQRYEDLKEIKDYVYAGNAVILDFAAVASEEVILKRITDELKTITSDVGGDIAGIGNNQMLVTPGGVKVDRRKIRGRFM